MVTTNKLDVPALEKWLWEAACKIRGDIDAPKYKEYILPLIFLKRLSDVFEDEKEKLVQKLGDKDTVENVVRKDSSTVRFYIPKNARWVNIAKQTTDVGQYLSDAVDSIAKRNSKLRGVIDICDFNASAADQRIISEEKLKALISILGRYRLGLKDVEADILGRAYEYLLRKFAEGSGQSAGEFYTPREVAILMAYILDPKPGEEICDPSCGSGGLLIKSYLKLKNKYGEKPGSESSFFGQEINHTTYAMARMNAFIHDVDADITLGDTIRAPASLNGDGSLRKFNKVTSNPMWNQDFPREVYENYTSNRFNFGYPPSSSADWGWIQHMYASLADRGKMVVVLDTGAVSRGSGNRGSSRERDIRKTFVEYDLVETVILLPENLFYNTTAPGIILVINKTKSSSRKRKSKIQFINASKLFLKCRPKNYLPEDTIKKIYKIYSGWKEEEGISKIISNEEAAKNDYNLSPSRYVAQESGEEILPLEEAVVELKEAEEERQEVDRELNEILVKLGLMRC